MSEQKRPSRTGAAGKVYANSGAGGRAKRKADDSTQGPAKRGRKGPQQTSLDDTVKKEQGDDDGAQTAARVQEKSKQDVGPQAPASEKDIAHTEHTKHEQRSEHDQKATARKQDEQVDASKRNGNDEQVDQKPGEQNDRKATNGEQHEKSNGFDAVMNAKQDTTKREPPEEGTGSKLSAKDGAVEDSARENVPHSILEKGIIYFFFRGRVGQNEPDGVNDVARSYIVLRPLPHDAKLSEGPIGDAGHNRILALPKKVLPVSPKDRFLCFVELAKGSMDDVKERFAASEYATKTAGARHTPSAAPIGEGVYAFTQTGRDTHLAYKLTIPEQVSEVQQDMGLQEQGSFVTSAKNPESSAPANAQLPQTANYPSDIQEEFRGRGWMPLQPRLLDYEFTQFLLIGHKDHALEKAAQPQEGDDSKETPLEEIEQLQQEDEERVQGLDGGHAVFADLGLSHREYPKLQTTW